MAILGLGSRNIPGWNFPSFVVYTSLNIGHGSFSLADSIWAVCSNPSFAPPLYKEIDLCPQTGSDGYCSRDGYMSHLPVSLQSDETYSETSGMMAQHTQAAGFFSRHTHLSSFFFFTCFSFRSTNNKLGALGTHFLGLAFILKIIS